MMNPQAIIQRACSYAGIDDITAKSHRPEYVRARRLAAWALWSQGIAVMQIGRLLQKDHSTVSHYLGTISRTDALLADEIAKPKGPPPEIAALRKLIDALDLKLDELERSYDECRGLRTGSDGGL